MVPELAVTDSVASLRFWVGLCGFEVVYDRPDEGFAYLRHGESEVMIDQLGLGRDWVTGPLEYPLGRGVNFTVQVEALDPVLARLLEAEWPLFMAPESKVYRTGDETVTVRQFLVQDPDGYLVRFSESARGGAQVGFSAA